MSSKDYDKYPLGRMMGRGEKNVELIIQRWMNAQRRKYPYSPFAKSQFGSGDWTKIEQEAMLNLTITTTNSGGMGTDAGRGALHVEIERGMITIQAWARE
jgi:hypothetical protein